MSLAWILKNPNVSTIILGASKEAQLLENLKSIEAQEKMTVEVMEKIEEVLTFR
jgi:aryl-alcohol dehydrogenase-like predicted oxidoreductase